MIFDTEPAVDLLYLSNIGPCLKTKEFVIIADDFLGRENILDMIEFTSEVDKGYVISLAKRMDRFQFFIVITSYFFLQL
ncbi:MAG: hypothetical protein QTN59_07430 [Candidatus Electrothrix communis]|nr:MAG: hypothetical protein QTN59_07430 [Candidatus Electrothrix communis]